MYIMNDGRHYEIKEPKVKDQIAGVYTFKYTVDVDNETYDFTANILGNSVEDAQSYLHAVVAQKNKGKKHKVNIAERGLVAPIHGVSMNFIFDIVRNNAGWVQDELAKHKKMKNKPLNIMKEEYPKKSSFKLGTISA